MKTFVDFEVWIGPPARPSPEENPSIFPVQVFGAPAGPASGELTLDVNGADFQSTLAKVRGIDPDLDLRRFFGGYLFNALFHGDVRDGWNTSRGRVSGGEADGLRLRLWINVPQLAVLPWEMLWDGREFLATVANMAVSRYLPVPEPPYLAPQEQLRILVVTASPPGLPVIDAREVERLEACLTQLRESMSNAIDYRILRDATMKGIQNALQEDFHILHFLGHGSSGQLFLIEDDKRVSVDDKAFAQLFQGRRSLRLVVLNACQSCQAEEDGLFTGIGPALVQKSLPAVVAMQYPFVQLDTAIQFSETFYGALANGWPVDVAVNEARQLLSAGKLLGDRDWSTPVLYMGTRSGRILDAIRPEAGEAERARLLVSAATQESDRARVAFETLTQRFQEIAAQHRKLQRLIALSGHVRNLRTDFEACIAIVEQADGVPHKLQLRELSQTWDRVRRDRIEQLRVFVDGHKEVDATSWFPEMGNGAASIDANLQQGAVGRLIDTVAVFGNVLSRAEADIRLQQEQVIADLVALSDRTLGGIALA